MNEYGLQNQTERVILFIKTDIWLQTANRWFSKWGLQAICSSLSYPRCHVFFDKDILAYFFLLVFINILWNPDIAPGASSKGVGIFSCIIYLRECLGCFLVLMSKGRFIGFQVLSGHCQSGSQPENLTSPWSRWWHLKIGKGGVVHVYCCSEERGCRALLKTHP